MPTSAPLPLDFRDVFFLGPEIVLTTWGLLVLLVDLSLARRLSSAARRRTIGWLSLAGVGLALVVALLVCLVPLYVRAYPEAMEAWFSRSTITYLFDSDPSLFSRTLAGDAQTGFFNILYVILLGLILWLSMAWSFTEEWGEYLALMFWATVAMMLLTAAEELVTLFLTLETMTICLYLCTALEKTKRRSAEGGLKYFVYGSVSSALFLFGLSLLYGLTGTTQLEAIRKLLLSPRVHGLGGNVAGATAVLLMMVGFGFKIAAVPFHQWAPDAYEGAPAPVTAWIATGSKLASFVALMKVFLHALIPWSNPTTSVMGPGWIGIIAIISAVTMTYGNFAALAQRNLKRMLAYSSIAHAGYLLVGVAAVSVSINGPRAAGAVLYYLVVYAFANVGAFAVAAWLVRDKKTDDIDDLNGLGFQEPLLATCILILMLSLIGIPPLAGFFGKLYIFMEALDQMNAGRPVTLIWLVALGLFNSVVSAFYYVRVIKAMFFREPGTRRLASADTPIALPILLSALVVILFGVMPGSLMSAMQSAAVPMLTSPAVPKPLGGSVVERGGPAPLSPDVQTGARKETLAALAGGGGPTGPDRAAGPQARGQSEPEPAVRGASFERRTARRQVQGRKGSRRPSRARQVGKHTSNQGKPESPMKSAMSGP
jgi:NADH-quinone oxidoreductase subunit N